MCTHNMHKNQNNAKYCINRVNVAIALFCQQLLYYIIAFAAPNNHFHLLAHFEPSVFFPSTFRLIQLMNSSNLNDRTVKAFHFWMLYNIFGAHIIIIFFWALHSIRLLFVSYESEIVCFRNWEFSTEFQDICLCVGKCKKTTLVDQNSAQYFAFSFWFSAIPIQCNPYSTHPGLKASSASIKINIYICNFRFASSIPLGIISDKPCKS